MTVALFDTAQVQAVADAIRAKDGDAAQMTVAQMPARIGKLTPYLEREVWLFANSTQVSSDIIIDTGIAGDLNHTIEVLGYGNIYSTTTLFGSVTSASSRQVINFLTSSNNLRVAWGNSGLKSNTYEVAQLSLWRPLNIKLSKTGFTLTGFTQGNAATSKSFSFSSVITTGASTAPYKIFADTAAGSTAAQPGVFRRARIRDSSNALIHDLVPVFGNDMTLKIKDKITGDIIATLPLGPADTAFQFVHNPQLDAYVNGKILTSSEALEVIE